MRRVGQSNSLMVVRVNVASYSWVFVWYEGVTDVG